MSTTKRIDTSQQTADLNRSTSEILSSVSEQSASQSNILGNLLTSQQQRSAETAQSLQQQSAALGAAFRSILDSYSSFSSEATDAASGANEAADRLAASRQAALSTPRNVGVGNLLRRVGTNVSPLGSGVAGSSRTLTNRANVFGRV